MTQPRLYLYTTQTQHWWRPPRTGMRAISIPATDPLYFYAVADGDTYTVDSGEWADSYSAPVGERVEIPASARDSTGGSYDIEFSIDGSHEETYQDALSRSHNRNDPEQLQQIEVDDMQLGDDDSSQLIKGKEIDISAEISSDDIDVDPVYVRWSLRKDGDIEGIDAVELHSNDTTTGEISFTPEEEGDYEISAAVDFATEQYNVDRPVLPPERQPEQLDGDELLVANERGPIQEFAKPSGIGGFKGSFGPHYGIDRFSVEAIDTSIDNDYVAIAADSQYMLAGVIVFSYPDVEFVGTTGHDMYHPEAATTVAASPRDNILLYGDEDNTLGIIDFDSISHDTGGLPILDEIDMRTPLDIDFAADTNLIAIGGEDGSVFLGEFTGSSVEVVDNIDAASYDVEGVQAVALTDDGEYLVHSGDGTGSGDGIVVRDITTSGNDIIDEFEYDDDSLNTTVTSIDVDPQKEYIGVGGDGRRAELYAFNGGSVDHYWDITRAMRPSTVGFVEDGQEFGIRSSYHNRAGYDDGYGSTYVAFWDREYIEDQRTFAGSRYRFATKRVVDFTTL